MRDEFNDAMGQDRATGHDAARMKVLQVTDEVAHLVQNQYRHCFIPSVVSATAVTSTAKEFERIRVAAWLQYTLSA